MEQGNKTEAKRIAHNTVFLYVRVLLVMLVSLFTVRITLQCLGVIDYGVYNAIGGVVLSLSFISSVLSFASQRFFSLDIGKNDTRQLNKTFNTMFFVYLIVALFCIIIGETLGLWFVHNKMTIPADRIEACNYVLHFSLLSFVASLVCNPFQALVIAKENMKIYAYISIVDVFLRLMLVASLLLVNFDKLILYSSLMFLNASVSNGLYVVYCRKKYPESRLSYKEIVFADAKKIFSYSSWTIFGTVSYVVNTQGVNILLNMFHGPVANASYSLGNQVKGAINTFSSNFYNAVRPPIIKSYARGEVDKMFRLFHFSTKTIFVLLYILILPLFAELGFVLKLWLGEIPPYLIDFTRLLLIYALVVSISDPISTIAQASGQVKKYHGIVDTFTLLSLPITYYAFKHGVEAQYVFIICICVFLIAHFIRLFILKTIVPFSVTEYVVNILLRFILCALLSGFIAFFTTTIEINTNIMHIVHIVFLAFVAVLTCWMVVLNKRERVFIFDLIKNRNSKKNG